MHDQQQRLLIVTVLATTVGLAVGEVHAAGLGIPLDGFLTTFLTWVLGLGLLIGTIGLAGWITSMFDNPFSTLLAGSVGYFTKAGLLGGGTVILPLLGLVGGATL
jgi:hypothetical protein